MRSDCVLCYKNIRVNQLSMHMHYLQDKHIFFLAALWLFFKKEKKKRTARGQGKRLSSVLQVMHKMQHRDFERAQTCRWNYMRDHSEQRNLLNLDIMLEDLTLCTETNHGRELLDHAKLSLLRGRHYGVVGRNGVGKSTLLRHIAEHKIMGIYKHLRCIYVDDSTEALGAGDGCESGILLADEEGGGAASASRTTLQHLLSKHKERLDLLKQLHDVLEGEGDVEPEIIEAVVSRLQLLQADAAEARARTVLLGLGISPDAELSTLSGGWKQRAALAAALFLEADVLLLDEPTNHLDIHAIIWLEDFLSRASSTVVVVSHDFEFLDHVATDMIEFSNLSLTPFKGNFSAYVATKQLQLQQQKRAFKCQEMRRRRMEATIEKLRVRAAASPASTGAYRMIKSRQQQLKHRLGVSLDNVYWKYGLMGPRPEILAPAEAEPFEFDFPTDVSDVPEAGKDGETTLVSLKDVSFSFTGNNDDDQETAGNVFGGVSLTVTLSTRLGLLGENGTGKTTLLKIIADELKPTTGDAVRWCGARIGYFRQDAIATISGDQAALQWLHMKHASKERKHIVDALGRFGIFGIHAEETPIRVMSSGEKARLLLADIMLLQPHVLLLDEPTSYLDAETSAAIVAGLETFEGAVVVATHDRTFMAQVATEMFCLDPWMFGLFEKDLEAYRDLVLAHKNGSTKLSPSSTAVNGSDKEKNASATSNRGAQHTLAPTATVVVSCRHCGGEHFSHSCTQRPKQGGLSLEQTEREKLEAARALQAEAAKPKPKPKLPPTTVVEDNEVWHVAISKSTKRRLEKGV